MELSSLLVCEDQAAVPVLRRVLDELGIAVELCPDPMRGFVRLAQTHFDLLIFDTEMDVEIVGLLNDTRELRAREGTLTVAMVAGHERIREMFALGVNFVLYKPVSYERTMSSLRAAQSAAYRDKRRQARAPLHTQAVIDYAGVQEARATLVDLAEGGLGVNFSSKMPPSCKVYFQFQLPGQTASVRLSGQVVWQDWNGRAGLAFVDVPQASRKLLSQWLQVNPAPQPERAEAETAAVQPATRPSADGGLVHSGGTKQDLTAGTPGDAEAISRLRGESVNRRGETRYACRIGAEVYQRGSSVRNYCHISDLSAGGCYLEIPLPLEVGGMAEIVVRTHEMKVKLSGVVKSSHPGYGMGVLFHLNTMDERRGVQQLIDFVAAAAESAG
jgi:CheY-like chemotaxis protein